MDQLDSDSKFLPNSKDSEIFLSVQDGVKKSFENLMNLLWIDWIHLGVEHQERISRIKNLEKILIDVHKDIADETRKQIDALEDDVQKLKEEAELLMKSLSCEINIPEFREDQIYCEYKQELEQLIRDRRLEMEERRSTLKKLLRWQEDLCVALEREAKVFNDTPLPTSNELKDFQQYLKEMQKERDAKAEIFLVKQAEIKDLLRELGQEPMLQFEKQVVSSLSVDFKYSDTNMRQLQAFHEQLQSNYSQLQEQIEFLERRVCNLWDYLEEDEQYRENFRLGARGPAVGRERALVQEVARCELIVKQKVAMILAKIRGKIKDLWDKCFYSPSDREEFLYYYQDVFNEDMLNLHEMYLEKLQNKYETDKALYELVETRRELWNKRDELEQKAKEPGRFNNRGGQLLKEERQRNTTESKLAKIEQRLQELAAQYECREGRPFTVDGKSLLALVQEENEVRKLERHNKICERKKAALPTTPSFRLYTYTSPAKSRIIANRSKRGLAPGSAGAASNRTAVSPTFVNRNANTVDCRTSSRLAGRAASTRDAVRRALDLQAPKRTKLAVNGSILKSRSKTGKRRSQNSRRSSSGKSTVAEPTAETSALTSYSVFQDAIEKKKTRSSAHLDVVGEDCATGHQTPMKTPIKTPIKSLMVTPMKAQNSLRATPLKRQNTPVKVPGTPLKLSTPSNALTPGKALRSNNNNEIFLTPRAPLSAKQNTIVLRSGGTPVTARSASALHMRTNQRV